MDEEKLEKIAEINEEDEDRIGLDLNYKRCFVDKQGNVIDPRTSWDDLLKYYRKYRRLLGVGAKSRIMSASTPAQAFKLIHQERKHQKNKKKASEEESKDLKRKEKKRKAQKRKQVENKEASYLKKTHEKN